jgi:hypothetical protein
MKLRGRSNKVIMVFALEDLEAVGRGPVKVRVRQSCNCPFQSTDSTLSQEELGFPGVRGHTQYKEVLKEG